MADSTDSNRLLEVHVEALDVMWVQAASCLNTAHACAGTPIQNNMAELFGIMSLLDAEEFGDEDAFLERYGGGRSNPMPDPEQVHALQVRPP